MLRLNHALGVLSVVLGLGSCGDPETSDLPTVQALRNRIVSEQKGVVVVMAWDSNPADQPVGTSLSGTASFELPHSGEAARDVEVVDIKCDMLCCGSRANKTPQWDTGAMPNQVRIWDIHPDSSGLWRVRIHARVDGNKAEDVDIVIRIP